MPDGTSSAAGDVGVARTGSWITRAMQPSTARGETSDPRPTGKNFRHGRSYSSACDCGSGAGGCITDCRIQQATWSIEGLAARRGCFSKVLGLSRGCWLVGRPLVTCPR